MKFKGIFKRIFQEYRYSTAKTWSLSDMGIFWDSVIDYDDINKEAYSYFRRFVDGYKLCGITDSSYILDISSRTGNGSKYFWQKGKIGSVVCADFSENFLSICAKNLSLLKVPFRTQKIDRLPLPFGDAEFDAVLFFETIEHVPNPEGFIKELSRVLKKNGQIVLSTPNILWGPVHSIAAMLGLHHSEGPHKFIGRHKLIRYINDAGLEILAQKTTVLIPAGPLFLIRIGEYLEGLIGNWLMSLFGLRRIFICKKH